MLPSPTKEKCKEEKEIQLANKQIKLNAQTQADMEKGMDTRTLSAEIFENCGNFSIVEDYAPLFSEENLFLVEMFDETFNIWHIYSL